MLRRHAFLPFLLAALTILLSGCTEVEYASHIAKTQFGGSTRSTAAPTAEGNFKIGNPYKVEGRWYYPREQYDLTETGIASWYGPGFHGKKTANGEIFDSSELTAAHRTLQMPSLVRVTNLDNGRSLIVRVNDRGPYKRGRVMDVSERAAELLGFKNMGTAKVKLQVLREESLKVAQAARAGQDTKGYEMAYNQGGQQPAYQQASYYGEGRGASDGGTPVVPGHNRNGEFYPDPVVTEYPVTPSRIYVQAGSFSVYDNAVHLKDSLNGVHPAEITTADVQGRPFYRVRLGPLSNVNEADKLLASLAKGGQQNSIIVVE